MQRNHRTRSFAPALNLLEGRVLLSASPSNIHAESFAKTATEVVFTEQGNYKKHVLTSVELMATVKPTSGTGVPTGTVTFEMVMPTAMNMKGMKSGMKGMMKSGTTVLGTVALTNGEAMITVKPKMAVKMPLEIIYNGDTNFASSTVTPAEVTKAELKGMSMDMGTSTGSGMKGMKM